MKIIIYKHNSIKPNIDDDIIKFKDYFAKHNLILDITVENTNVAKGYAGRDLFLLNDRKYDVVMYVYERGTYQMNSAGLAMSFSKTLQAIYLSVSTADDNIDYTWKSMAHEMMHCLFFKYNINPIDPMDLMFVPALGKYMPYYKNEELDAPDGNFAEAWKRLVPYLKTVILTRKLDNGKETLGQLSYKNFTCLTIERPYKKNEKNISSIPEGTYYCRYSFSPKFLKYTYELVSVPNRYGIRIHSANYWFQLNGCIALGNSHIDINNDKQLDVVNSRNTVKAFETLMDKKPFYLTIKKV